MTDTPTQRFLRALYQTTGEEARQNGKGWSARCPAHEDRHPSLSIGEGDGGRCLLDCKTGCATPDVVAAVGLSMPDLFPDDPSTVLRQTRKKRQNAKPARKSYPTAHAAVAALDGIMAKEEEGRRVAQWPYHAADGKPVAVVVRYDLPTAEGEKQEKTFRPVARRGDEWIIGGMPEPRPLYGLPDLAKADRVFITEGEKSADAARSIRLSATTSAHGALSPGKTDWSPLAGKECVKLPDNDKSGDEFASEVQTIIGTLSPPAVFKLVQLPGLPHKGDMADFVAQRRAAGKTDTEIRAEVESLADEAEAILIRAYPRERDRARIEFCPIPASQLGDGEQVEWLWHGYVARGFVTLLVGLWKAGKSTLISYLLNAMESGGDLAGTVRAAKVLVITEEGSGLWARRRDEVGFGDHAHFDIRPFKCRPRQSGWEQYIESVTDAVRRGEYDLVIVDTWASVNPCADENDAAGTMAALSPLHGIAEAGAGILLAHHPLKCGNRIEYGRLGGTVSAADLIADLTRMGIRLEAHGDRLRYSPRSAVTPELIERMKANKPELLVAMLATPKVQNVHFKSNRDDWETPQWLFDELNSEFGFDLDVCADKMNAKCTRYFSRETDGLSQTWHGTCWMNPPYGREIGRWMAKAYESSQEGATVVCLVPARTDTKW